MKKRIRNTGLAAALLIGVLAGSMIFPMAAQAAGKTTEKTEAQTETEKTKTRWEKLMDQYRNKKNTDRLIFVKYEGGTKATLKMFKKVKNKSGKNVWKRVLKCRAYVGRNGINKQREGDVKTPTGTFRITEGFGIKKNPGLKGLKYTKLKWYHYWSGEQATYNKMVDVRKLNRTWMAGEHLITYSPHYNYALNMGYNQEGVYKKGSALFLHCTGSNPYTGGCVAVSEKNMIKILKNTTKRTRICIYPTE